MSSRAAQFGGCQVGTKSAGAPNRVPAPADGVLSIKDLAFEEYGWEVHDFLEVVIIEGVAFSHYFTSGTMGRPVTTAQACLTKKHMSCVQGHQQG